MNKTTIRVAIVGAGDLGRTLQRQLSDIPELQLVGFFDDTCVGASVAEYPVLGTIDDSLQPRWRVSYDAMIMAIGYRHLKFRQQLFERLSLAGVKWATVVHPSAIVASNVELADGVFISAGCVLDVGVKVGVNSFLNIGCVVCHDCHIGAHTFLGPSVTIAGFVRVGERCFIGIGTTVIDNRTLGDDCQTAGGAVVIADVRSGTLVAGVPAIEKKMVQQ
ncbi:MAG: NeuD/PglB/VioB family sugar acetyltransferase [Planctomycetales bacterium]|nr:NeuD/PglB/VioB family sugar acetyltransferase [Planctomycetales bacterium]